MKRWSWLLPVLLAAIVFVPAPWGELVWDDYFIATQLSGLQSIGDVFFPPEGLQGWTYAYYRPVLVLSYMLDAWLFGPSATFGPHLLNLLCHVAGTYFVWLLTQQLLCREKSGGIAAILSASLFAVHPIHAESVYWIAARGDILAAGFLLPSVILALRWTDEGKVWQLILAGLLYLLALMSKEVAIAALIIVPATLLLARPDSSTTRGRAPVVGWVSLLGLYLSATGIYLLLRFAAMHSADVGGLRLEFGNAMENIIRAGGYYLVKALIPWPQSNVVVWEMLPGLAVSSLILLAGSALLVLAVWWWRRQGDGAPLLGAIWFLATLAPSLVIAVSDFSGGAEIAAAGKFPVAERYLYLPSVGLALALGSLLCVMSSTRWRKRIIWAGIAVVMTYSAATIARGYTWHNNLRLWSDTTAKVTTHGPPWNELGRAFLARGEKEQALQSFLHALTLKNSSPERATISHNIGSIYLQRRNLPQAEAYFRVAIEAKPNMAEAHYGLGSTYTARVGRMLSEDGSRESLKADMNLAFRHYTAAARINPDFHLARLLAARIQADYGQILEREGQPRQAIVAYRSARAQIDAIISGIPEPERQQYVEAWSTDVNVDLQQLSARVDANLQRLVQ
jgi:tetratricopeptide (TPR) repeat protein